LAERQKQIIAITGYSAVGKSSLARSISEHLDMGLFSLGNHQRAQFGAHGTPPEYHAKFGLFATYYSQWSTYIDEISKNSSGDGVVVESVYSHAFLELMKSRFPEHSIHLMAISANREDRLRFLRLKADIGPEEAERHLDELDRIKNTVGLAALLRRGIAQLELINNGDLDTFLRKGIEAAKILAQGTIECQTKSGLLLPTH
jgi:cytidylate kinase